MPTLSGGASRSGQLAIKLRLTQVQVAAGYRAAANFKTVPTESGPVSLPRAIG
jgi:hypothetical protein